MGPTLTYGVYDREGYGGPGVRCGSWNSVERCNVVDLIVGVYVRLILCGF